MRIEILSFFVIFWEDHSLGEGGDLYFSEAIGITFDSYIYNDLFISISGRDKNIITSATSHCF